jgi:DNA-binding response OmpR family regulator
MDLIAQKAARGPKTGTIPIILFSARDGGESRVEGMRPGVDSYLIKSFSARQLLARVEAHLKTCRYRPEATETLRTGRRVFAPLSPRAFRASDALAPRVTNGKPGNAQARTSELHFRSSRGARSSKR